VNPEQRMPEQEPAADRPRIYVASLADYNAGWLHGAWIDADQATSAIEDAIAEILRTSRTPLAEEWAIHDHEGFDPFPVGEFCSIETLSLLACRIREHGPAFAAWAAHLSSASEADDSFSEAFSGEWESISDYAEQMLDDFGLEAAIDSVVPEGLRAYVRIDAEGLGRDLVLGGDVVALDTPSGSVWIFQGGIG
jgi:antirestriction protein